MSVVRSQNDKCINYYFVVELLQTQKCDSPNVAVTRKNTIF